MNAWPPDEGRLQLPHLLYSVKKRRNKECVNQKNLANLLLYLFCCVYTCTEKRASVCDQQRTSDKRSLGLRFLHVRVRAGQSVSIFSGKEINCGKKS